MIELHAASTGMMAADDGHAGCNKIVRWNRISVDSVFSVPNILGHRRTMGNETTADIEDDTSCNGLKTAVEKKTWTQPKFMREPLEHFIVSPSCAFDDGFSTKMFSRRGISMSLHDCLHL